MDGTLQILTFQEIVHINRRMLSKFGITSLSDSLDNLLNPGSLEYILSACQGLIFGQDLYPTVINKAAAICYNIITRHVFHDGNKRTGLEVCRQILELNNYKIAIDREAMEVILSVGAGEISEKDFTKWVENRAVEIIK